MCFVILGDLGELIELDQCKTKELWLLKNAESVDLSDIS